MNKTKGILVGVVAVLLLAVLFGAQSTLFKGAFQTPNQTLPQNVQCGIYKSMCESGDTGSCEGYKRQCVSTLIMIAKNPAMADQSVVAGTQGALIGSFTVKTTAATAKITEMALNLITTGQGVSGYTNLKLCRGGTSCVGVGNQYGQTMSTAASTNRFTISNLNVSTAPTVIDVHADVRSGQTAGTVTGLFNPGSVTASDENMTALSNTPSAIVRLQTVAVGIFGRLIVTEPSQVTGTVIHPNEPEFEILAINMKAENEPISISELSVTLTNGSFNLGTLKLKDDTGQTLAQTLVRRHAATQNHQYAKFSGFRSTIGNNATKVYKIYATTTPAGTLKSQDTVAVHAAYVRATGDVSGQLINPTLTSVEVSTASPESAADYYMGDIVFYDDGTTGASSGMVLEEAPAGRNLATYYMAAPFSTGLVLNDPDDASVGIAAGRYVSKFDKTFYTFERASTAAKGLYRPGDLVYFVDYSADTGVWATVTSSLNPGQSMANLSLKGGGKNSADTTGGNGTGGAAVWNVGDVDVNGSDADFIAKLTNTTNITLAAPAGNLAVGDVAFLNDASRNVTYPFITVYSPYNFSLLNDFGVGSFAGNGFFEAGSDNNVGSMVIDAGDTIKELNRISSETLSATGTGVAFDYLPGDVVFVYASTNAATRNANLHGFYVVKSPVRRGESLIGNTTMVGTGVALAAGDIITKVSSPISSNAFKALAGELELRVPVTSPPNNSQLSIGADVTMGILDARAIGVPVYIESIVVQKVGSGEHHLQGLEAERGNRMKVLVNGVERVHLRFGGGNWMNSELGFLRNDYEFRDYYLIDFAEPIQVQTSTLTTLTFLLTTTATNGTWAVNETLGLRIGGAATAGARSSLGVDFYWDEVQGDAGVTPLAGSPVSENDHYPIVFGLLRYQ